MAHGSDIVRSIGLQSNLPLLNFFNSAQNQQQARDINQQTLDQRQQQAPFQNQLLQLESQLAEAQQPARIQEAEEAASPINQFNRREKARFQSLVQGAQSLSPFLETGDVEGARQNLLTRKKRLQKIGLPTDDTDQALNNLDSDFELLKRQTKKAIELGQQSGFIKAPTLQQRVAVRSSAPITDPETGQVSIPTFDPNTGKTKLVPVKGAVKETPEQKSFREVGAAGRKKRAELTEQRTSDLKKQFSSDRRAAKSSLRKLSEASKLASKATQGIPGQGKLLASRFFPGIDASNEGALSAAFKNLALDELQKFTGPTTDFEFSVTEDIAGSLGSGATANRARIASLQRAAWFANRQAEQFDRWIDGGHNPDRFAFDFDEKITPIKGGDTFTLRDIQDTAVANNISIDEVLKRLKDIR